jgi:NAD(P)-dependent dehydrogenase (short-subunit alcohol dehydrogenase family)
LGVKSCREEKSKQQFDHCYDDYRSRIQRVDGCSRRDKIMPNGALEGKTALVTGAASGIGRASALLFAAEGARVAAVDRNQAGVEETAHLISASGGAARPLRADLTHADQVSAAVQATVQAFGQLDVMFNVAGGSGRRWGDGPTAECTEEGWDFVLATNLKSQFLCCKYAIPEMLKNGAGSIVNLSSILGLVGGDADFATHAYAASKGGVISLTRSIAAYYAKDGIRANVICPALIATPMSKRAQTDAGILARLPQLQPLTGDFGTPEDVAQAALYLASDRSRFVTGAVLTVDGGWTVL